MAGQIYITGDKHGTMLPLFGLAENNELQAEDVLIITGDAGVVWDETYPKTIATLEQTFPGVAVFVDGNHENHDLLNAMEVMEWNGGRVHKVGGENLPSDAGRNLFRLWPDDLCLRRHPFLR